MKQYFSGLRARLLLLVLFAVVPAFAINVYTVIRERQQAATSAERDARNLTQLAAREHRRLLASTRQYLVSLSKLPEVRKPTSVEACHRTLAEVHSPFSYYRLIGLALANGNVYCRSLPIYTKVNINDRGYFQRAMETRDFGIGDYQIGRATLKPSINFGQAAVDEAGNVRTVVFAALDIDWLNQLLATNELPEDSSMEVIDNDGTILARFPNPEGWVGKTLPNSVLIQTILAQRKEGIAELRGLDGINRFYSFAPLHDSPSGKVYVAVGLSSDVAYATANANLISNAVLAFIMIIFGTLMAWTIGDRFVLRRIQALVAAAKRLGEGDLTARSGLPHGHTEEIGRLAATFDHMANGLQLMTVALQRVNRALKTLSGCNRLIVAADDERRMMNDICRSIVRIGGYHHAWIGYADHTPGQAIRTAAQFGQNGETDELPAALIDQSWADNETGRGLIAHAIRTVKPCVTHISTSFTTEWAHIAGERGIQSAVAFPITIQGKAIGAILICAAEADAFNAEERDLLNEAAQDIAVGISMLRTRAEHDQVLKHMAYFDDLTGLPNRAYLEQQLRRVISDSQDRGESFALAIVDINRLWEVNNALGFHHGDHLLKEIGTRIRSVFSKETLVARMRGDEYAVLLTGHSATKIKEAIQSILSTLHKPMILDGISLEVSAVVGVSLFPNDGEQTVELIRHADVAMHQAKKSGQGYAFYSAENDEDYAKRLSLVGELRQAIESNELRLYYQPKVDVRDGHLCGMEALVRWIHPQRGLIPPDDFISLAEQSGLINPLTDWVIGAALKQSAIWRAQRIAVPIAVNLSARTLHDGDFLGRLQLLLRNANAAPSWLELELTEGAIMEDAEGALDILRQISAMGITLFIDDFGTGYSSLAYLKKLPVDAVKIDKSFVIDMLADSDSATIVRSTIGLAHDLDLKVVAEGVESQAAFDELAILGCDVAQGYYLSKPMPADQLDMTAWVKGSKITKLLHKVR